MKNNTYWQHLIWIAGIALLGIGYIKGKTMTLKYKIAQYHINEWAWGTGFSEDLQEIKTWGEHIISLGTPREHIRVVKGEDEGAFVTQLMYMNEGLAKETVPNYANGVMSEANINRVKTERGFGGNDTTKYVFSMPVNLKELHAWLRLQERYQEGHANRIIRDEGV